MVSAGAGPGHGMNMTLATLGSILILAGIIVLAAGLALPFVYARRLRSEEAQ
jgi:uncharacterized membrane protein